MNKINNFLIAIFIACFFMIAGCNQPGSSDNPTPPGAGAGPAAVNLGTAANFAILSESGISTTLVPPASASAIVGNIGVSPIGYASITGFNLSPAVPIAATTSATSLLVTGTVYAANYTGNGGSTPTMLTAAIGDKNTAYLDAVGRTAIVANTNLYAGSIGGQNFAPGLYTWTTPVLIGSTITLTGGANDRWIFQISGTLTLSPGVSVSLSGGALAKNIVWQATDTVALDTTATLNGIVLTAPAKSITLNAGATVNGRLLAGGGVTLISNTVTQP
jgi:hypothetical protein